MAWYSIPNNTTGLANFFNATQTGMASQNLLMGSNMVAVSMLIPIWILIFLPMAKFNVGAAFITANFVCWILTVFMMTIGMVNTALFTVFTILLTVSAIIFYLITRQ